VALRKLIQILPLLGILTAAGGAFASEGKVSPNLTIVEKAKKSDKKQKVGFTAFMKQSAQNWGRGFVRLVANAAQPKRQYATARTQKKPLTLIKTALHKRAGALTTHAHAILFEYSDLAVSHTVAIRNTKEGLAPECLQPSMSDAPSPPRRCLPGHNYALKLPSLRYFLDWFRPVAAASGRVVNDRDPAHTIPEASLAQGEIPAGSSLTPLKSHNHTSTRANSGASFHFTIDLTQAHTSLTHGAMGAGSALPGDRLRDHRA
jgi:hypothetical protein